MQHNKNYISYTPLLLLATIAILSVVSLYRGGNIAGIEIKRSNIYRDITPKRELVAVNIPDTTTTQQKDTTIVAPTQVVVAEIAEAPKDSVVDSANKQTSIDITLIEDYSTGSSYSSKFREDINNIGDNNLRLAFLGDSYIEGDILTMDLRTKLQQKFGGGGVGYVPITSVVSKYRTSVIHTFSDDWDSKSAVKYPSDGDYILSGYKFIPSERSFVEYKMSSNKKRLNEVNRSTLLYMAKDSSMLKILVNGKDVSYYELINNGHLQSITVENPNIKTIRYEFEDVDGLTVYGALHDTKSGVSVDNFSLRGEMGNLPSVISQSRIRELNEMVEYGLIVLQYGLNFNAITENSELEYYSRLITKGVKNLKETYPNTPILIMGVGPIMSRDDDGSMVIKRNIHRIEQMQREVAKNTKSMFWSTIDAVEKLGGLELFVNKRWASKDYTHITSLGGEKLAGMLYEALINRDIIKFEE